MIRAILFDFDGLLADSEPLQKAAWRAYLQQHGHRLEDSLVERMFGLRLRESAELVRAELGLPFAVEQIMAERDAIFLDSLRGTLQPMPGAHAIVASMREYGLRIALATSGHRRYVPLALAELGLSEAFDVIVTGDSVARGKPAPDIFVRAAALLDVPPAACVVLEDAPHGVAAARAAGMTVIAVPNELTRELDLSAAAAILPSLAAAQAWIEARLEVQR
jgi:HAD superfamily hydrolase (TIGR01509 family)